MMLKWGGNEADKINGEENYDILEGSDRKDKIDEGRRRWLDKSSKRRREH
jgi:hypothetical protein